MGRWWGEPRVTPPRRPSRSWVAFMGAGRGSCSLRGGVTRGSLRVSRAALVLICVAIVVAGCGEGGEVASGATVAAYVAAPLCLEARKELARHGGQAGDVRVRVTCLPSAEDGRKLDLATIGANARRATEDSSAVAYIGERTRAATRFSEPILEAAGIRQYAAMPGSVAMRKLLKVLNDGEGWGRLADASRSGPGRVI